MRSKVQSTVCESQRIVSIPASSEVKPTFGPLVSTCAKYGIKRGMAFRLAREFAIKTFVISRKRFVTIASIEALANVEVGDE